MIPSHLLALFGTKVPGTSGTFGTQELSELRNFWRSLANCSRWEHCQNDRITEWHRQNDIEWLVQTPYIPADCTQNATPHAAYSLAKPDIWWALTSRCSLARSLGASAHRSQVIQVTWPSISYYQKFHWNLYICKELTRNFYICESSEKVVKNLPGTFIVEKFQKSRKNL